MNVPQFLHPKKRVLRLLIPVLAAALLLLVAVSPLSKQKTKGVYYEHAGIVAQGKECKPDSAQGVVLRMDRDHDNPLFQSKLPNRIHLLMWFKEGIPFGQRLQLPAPNVEVCYWEKGDLLMFHTTKPLGWIEFAPGKMGAPVSGKMEFKLIEPDHNMSNSDYHFLGGQFSFVPSKL